jgi:hypothetical protein
MKNKRFFDLGILLFFGILLVGCDTGTGGNKNGGNVDIAKEDLVGVWHRTSGYPRLTLNADASWSSELWSIVSFSDPTTWSVSGSTLTLKYLDNEEDSGTDQENFTVALSDDKQTLTVANTLSALIKGTYIRQN